MSDSLQRGFQLPSEQQAIRDKCFHPSGIFVEFPIEDVETSIPERFEEIVRRHPENIAVKMGTEQITYDELNKAANRVAHAIVAPLGQGQEPVALFIERGTLLVIASMAVLKAGKVAIHADPSTSRERVDRILDQSQAAMVLIDRRTHSLAREWVGNSRAMLDVEELTANVSEENLNLSLSPDSYAEISFTSGSTGQAKGAVITHRQRLHEAMTFANLYHICPQDRLGNFGPSSIGKQLFYALLNGATQYPVSHRSEGLLHIDKWLIEEGITIFISLPTAFRHLVNTAPTDERFPNLRVIRLCGEPLIRRDVELYQQQFSSGCVLVNMYASKEAGTISQYLIDKNTLVLGSRVPVGYPEDGVVVCVVDDLANQVPYDQSGEIVVQSRFLSSGYWQGDAPTANPPDPKTVETEERRCFTGDIGRLSKDGLLEHLGRKDSMVKIRSFRVDIGEVEAKLSNHPGVKEAAVIAKEDSFGGKTLIAYFVPLGHPTPTVTSLRNFLGKDLPDYMIPATFISLLNFPLLATGKINRRALPDPDKSRPALATVYASPTTPIEQQLVKVWGEILSLDRIGIHDNFFELGGHSLAATRVVSQVIKQFQLEIPLRSLFESPTVAEMSAVITEHQGKLLGKEELERLLSELELMSDEEAQQLVAKESVKG